MSEERTEPDTEDVAGQEAELLPDREAMSLIQPFPHEGAEPLEGMPLEGIEPDATDTPGSESV